GAVKWERDQTTGDHRPHWVKLIFERCRNAEVSSSTSHGPEEIGIFLLVRPQHLAFRRNDLHRSKVVERQPVFRHQPAQSPSEREPRYGGGGYDTASDRKPVLLRFSVEFGPGHTALSPNGTSAGIDVNPFHRREVDHEPAIDGGATRHVVTAAANRHFKA